MKKFRYSLTVCFLLGGCAAWCGGGTPVPAVRIDAPSITFSDDSVRIETVIFPQTLRISRSQAMTLRFTLESGGRKVDLPSVVFSGSRRDRFDRRERILAPDPHAIPRYVYTKWRKVPDKTYAYRITVPYAGWMRRAELVVTQVLSGCGNGKVFDRKVLLKGFDAGLDIGLDAGLDAGHSAGHSAGYPSTPVTAPHGGQDTLPSASPLPPVRSVDSAMYGRDLPSIIETPDMRPAKVTFRIDYPRGVTRVISDFGNNSRELAKVDSLFGFLNRSGLIRIERISITGYASIEGGYAANENLAWRRSFQFEDFIRERYDPGNVPVRLQWVAEDWEGLRQQVLTSSLSSKWDILRIIDHTDIFEGREKQLMDLSWGDPYRLMLSIMFPSLRRIEMEVCYTVLHPPPTE